MPAGWQIPLHLEICRKHLIYNGACIFTNLIVSDQAEEVSVQFGQPGGLGPSHALGLPLPTRFALGLDSVGGHLDLYAMQLEDATGRKLLRNAAFEQGVQWWFFSSDRYHLPYHAKNVGLACARRARSGRYRGPCTGRRAGRALARRRSGQPASAGAAAADRVAGFFVVGVFDSLLDATRLVMLATLLAGVALALRPGGSPGR